MNKLNIWYITAYDYPRGQSARTYNFALELIKMGHNVTIVTNGFNHFSKEEYLQENEKYRIESIDGIKVLWLKTTPYYNNGLARIINMLSNAWQAYFKSNLIKVSPDIVFGPSVPLFTALSAYFIAKKRHAKFVFESRDVWPHALVCLGYLSEKSILTFFLKKLAIFLYKKSDHIVSVLPYIYGYISKYNIEKNKISYIPNGTNLSLFKECEKNNFRQDDMFTVKWLGKISTAQDISTIIACAKRMKDKPIKFVLTGASKEEVQYFSSALLNYKNISVRPLVVKSKVAHELMNSDVLILSYKNTGVFEFGINSNKIYDYLAAGKPIIFSANSPNNQILEANAGIVIPPENVDEMCAAVEKIFCMTKIEREKLGENGRVFAESELDVKELSKKLYKVLRLVSEEPTG